MSLVTCVMPTFGQAHYLADNIRSVLAQTVRDLSLLVVPVRGDEQTRLVLEPILKANDRVCVVVSQYACIPHQMTLGMSFVRLLWSFFSGSDDLWYPTTCEQYLDMARKTIATVVYPKWMIGNAAAQPVRLRTDIPKVFDARLLATRCFVTDCSFVAVSKFRQALPLKMADGNEFIYRAWKQLARDSSNVFVHLDEPAFIYRQHQQAESQIKMKDRQPEWHVVRLGKATTKESAAWPVWRSETSRDRRAVICVTEPALLSTGGWKIPFKKVVVLWPDKAPSVDLVESLRPYPYIHLCHKNQVQALRVLRPRVLTKPRPANWWFFNDVYSQPSEVAM